MTIAVSVIVNGEKYDVPDVEPRMLLSDFLRDQLGLTGTHVGCEHGVCGACTVLVNGHSVRSCLMLAVQTGGAEIVTVEGLGSLEELNELQAQFREHHGLQCGFCTPGMLMTGEDLLRKYPLATDEALSGNLCRCTGYQNIVAAIRSAAAKRTEKAS
jgi:aerobic carbon-monoxide dehydrogenase small subunit